MQIYFTYLIYQYSGWQVIQIHAKCIWNLHFSQWKLRREKLNMVMIWLLIKLFVEFTVIQTSENMYFILTSEIKK